MKKADVGSLFGSINPRQPRPDFGSYTPKISMNRGHKFTEPIALPNTSKIHLKNKALVRSLVGPQSYEVMPDIKKRNHNHSTFELANRRFKFNANIEAVDKRVTSRNGPGIFERRRIFLTGMKGHPSPGPGTYVAPSEFG